MAMSLNSTDSPILPPPTSIAASDNGSTPNRWLFSKTEIENSPSRKSGLEVKKELGYRIQSARFIQDVGDGLKLSQLCINTAIVYMHRFYMHHPFSSFCRFDMSSASIFLAAKIEDQPRKLKDVLKCSKHCFTLLCKKKVSSINQEVSEIESDKLIANELVLIQTLGFDFNIDHPETHVLKLLKFMKQEPTAYKELTCIALNMITNCMHLTTMCLQYRPTTIACMCIHLACKWSDWKIPISKENKEWWLYVDDACTVDQLDMLTSEFLEIFNKVPTMLKTAIRSIHPYRKHHDAAFQPGIKPVASSSNKPVSMPSHPTPSRLKDQVPLSSTDSQNPAGTQVGHQRVPETKPVDRSHVHPSLESMGQSDAQGIKKRP